jgi:hypothetical protein
MVKFLLRRVRRFLGAEILDEVVALRAEVAALRRDAAGREDLTPLIRQMEAALLTIALGHHHASGERVGLRAGAPEGAELH